MCYIHDKIVIGGFTMREKLEAMTNKRFATTCFELLIRANVLDDTTLNQLINPEWCQRTFEMTGNKPILKEIPNEFTEEELRKYQFDGTHQQRFYPNVIKMNGRSFIITNYWYGKDTRIQDNRTPFMDWVLNKILRDYQIVSITDVESESVFCI